ncbi:PHP domain-containing protein, partial [Escherichia coli]
MLYYDLHIHSCLSPCAQEDMTPANICAMARLKGLDVIALTDHNTGGNLTACEEAARREGLLFLP